MGASLMASEKWEFDARLNVKRYRNTESGRFISNARIAELRQQFSAAREQQMAALTQRLVDGDLTVRGWQREMGKAIKLTHGGLYEFGRGGQNALTDDDRAAVARTVSDQKVFLRGFAEDLAAGKVSPAQAINRAGMYASSGVQSFERGKAGAFRVTLPAHPGDGSSECKANDLCHWRMVETADDVEATWVLGGTQPCDTCSGRSVSWSPLVFAKVTA